MAPFHPSSTKLTIHETAVTRSIKSPTHILSCTFIQDSQLCTIHDSTKPVSWQHRIPDNSFPFLPCKEVPLSLFPPGFDTHPSSSFCHLHETESMKKYSLC